MSKLVVTLFGAEWCQPCKSMEPALRKAFADESAVTFRKVDIEVDADVAVQHSISSVPTIVMEKDGVVVDRLVGARPIDAIVNNALSFLE